ncbi:MAG: hypothetical protein ACFUZC_08420 [Chthoniobacteraceae bacterium]
MALLEKRSPSGDEEASAWTRRAIDWITETAPALAKGGFHTPNHRWVITSALTLALELAPSLRGEIQPAMDAYLAEGLDIDSDGFWLERSVGIYDGVTNRSLLILQEYDRLPGALEAVRKNLEADLFLIHGDGTAETVISKRQDAGKKAVPASLIPCYIRAGIILKEPKFLAAADLLWSAGAEAIPFDDLFWTRWSQAWHGDPTETPAASLPDHYWHVFPTQRVARYRNGKTEATVVANDPSYLRFRHGEARILGVRFFQAIHGVGLFSADAWEPGEHGVRLSSSGYRHQRPGYMQPLGKPVPWDQWEETIEERDLRYLPPLDVEIQIEFHDSSATGRIQTLGALPGGIAELAIDVPAGGVLELEGGAFPICPQQEIFLEHGSALIRFGEDTIRIGSGNRAHRLWHIKDLAPPAQCARIVIPFRTPVDASFSFQGASFPALAPGLR